jgi:capsule polysaccharide export protein KpsE/RkpR
MKLETIQPIEGITPGALWTTLYVLLALCLIVITVYKVVEIIRKERERKQARRPELADEISGKVLEKLEPRLAEIDRKLANDKALIDNHTRQIAAVEARQDAMERGQKAQCRGVLALLNHELHNGNSDEMERAQAGMNDYLIDK